MKTAFVFIVSSFLLAANINAQETKLADHEKIFVEKYLKETMAHLQETVESMEGEVLTFKPGSDSWSVLDCLEHLTITEFTLLAQIQEIVRKNDIDLKKDYSGKDGLIISEITNRTRKVKTLQPFEPKGQSQSKKVLLKQLSDARQNVLHYLQSTNGDLRHLFAPYPYGEADVYQQFLIIGAHMVRHTMQIEELLNTFESKKM